MNTCLAVESVVSRLTLILVLAVGLTTVATVLARATVAVLNFVAKFNM